MEPTNELSCTLVSYVYNLKKSLALSNTFCSASKSSVVEWCIGTEGGGVAWKGPNIKMGTPHTYLVRKQMFISGVFEGGDAQLPWNTLEELIGARGATLD